MRPGRVGGRAGRVVADLVLFAGDWLKGVPWKTLPSVGSGSVCSVVVCKGREVVVYLVAVCACVCWFHLVYSIYWLLFVCVMFYLYTAKCGPKGRGLEAMAFGHCSCLLFQFGNDKSTPRASTS